MIVNFFLIFQSRKELKDSKSNLTLPTFPQNIYRMAVVKVHTKSNSFFSYNLIILTSNFLEFKFFHYDIVDKQYFKLFVNKYPLVID